MTKERSSEATNWQSQSDESNECSEEKHEAINQKAVATLEVLLKDAEGKWGEEEYETEFLGDLYARMIISVYMGYFPQKMGEDAEAGALRLMELTGVDMEEIEDEAEKQS